MVRRGKNEYTKWKKNKNQMTRRARQTVDSPSARKEHRNTINQKYMREVLCSCRAHRSENSNRHRSKPLADSSTPCSPDPHSSPLLCTSRSSTEMTAMQDGSSRRKTSAEGVKKKKLIWYITPVAKARTPTHKAKAKIDKPQRYDKTAL